MQRSLTQLFTIAAVAACSSLAAAACPADLTGDDIVDAADLAQLLGAWGPDSGPADLNGDGLVNAADLAQLLGAWGPCPPECPTFGLPMSTEGLAVVQFGSPQFPPIPDNFFFPNSPPLFGDVDFVGNAIDDTLLGTADLFIELDGPVCFPGQGFPRPSQPVEIEIKELSLTGVQPIMVETPNGPEAWLVSMGLSGEQAPGQLQATMFGPDGGQYQAQVPVLPVFTFARESEVAAAAAGDLDPEDVDVRILDYAQQGWPPVQLQWGGHPWSTTPPVDGALVCSSGCDETPVFLDIFPVAGEAAPPSPISGDGFFAQAGAAHAFAPGAKTCLYGRFGQRSFFCGGCAGAVPLVYRSKFGCDTTADCPSFVTRSWPCPGGGAGRCIGFFANTACN